MLQHHDIKRVEVLSAYQDPVRIDKDTSSSDLTSHSDGRLERKAPRRHTLACWLLFWYAVCYDSLNHNERVLRG